MRVKKQIALLLSGAILAGSLAGCSRTIIEHQFHTDTEYIETIVENSGMNGAEKLTSLFWARGIKFDFDFIVQPGVVESDTGGDSIFNSKYELETTPIEDDDISWFYTFQTNPNASVDYGDDKDSWRASLPRVIKCDDISDMTSAWLVYANSVYEALVNYLNKHFDDWDWDKFYEGNKGKIVLDGYIVNISPDPTNPEFYAAFALG